MCQIVELSDPVYRAFREAAEQTGLTPADWIAEQLAIANGESAHASPRPAGTATSLADLFAGRTGRIASSGHERLAEQKADAFADHLEAKRRAGHL